MKRAFTLIELLVVIAIIAILAAILFPVFAQAKEAAKKTQVLSNQKQIAIAQTMYITDSDDTLPAWFTKAADASDGTPNRTDIVSWPQMFYPYIKNGLPQTNLPASATGVKSTGVQFNPSWDEAKWKKAAELPDCDGAGALDSYVPIVARHSDFGMTLPFNSRTGVNYLSDPASADGTAAKPDYYFAGSYLPGTPTNGRATRNVTMNLGQVNEVSRTALVTDGFTGVVKGNGFATTVGCEASSIYAGGGNIAFLDSHAKFVKGNSQRYVTQGSDGRYFQTYFTIDR